MLIQAIMRGYNRLAAMCHNRIGRTSIGQTIQQISAQKALILYHATCEAIEGGVIGACGSYAYMRWYEIGNEPGGALVVVVIMIVSGAAFAAVGATMGVLRGCRIAATGRPYPYYYELIMGTLAGAGIGAWFNLPTELFRVAVIGGAGIGAVAMGARMVSDLVRWWFSPRPAHVD